VASILFITDLCLLLSHLDGYATLKLKKIKFSSYIKKIQSGAVEKSYMRKGFLIYEEMRKYLVIFEEAVTHL
jgi:hypothetical protein